MDGFDIVSSIRNHLRTMAPHQRERLTAQQLELAANEIERLRLAIRRLAEQDATLSVCNGNVTVEMDATLTGEERQAIQTAMNAYGENNDDRECEMIEATLWGLLERTK